MLDDIYVLPGKGLVLCVRYYRNSEVGSLFFSSSSMSASAASATRYVSLETGMCVIEAERAEKRSRRTLVLVAHTAAALVLTLVLGFTPAATLTATLAATPAATPAEHLRGGGHPLTAFAKTRSVRAPAETTLGDIHMAASAMARVTSTVLPADESSEPSESASRVEAKAGGGQLAQGQLAQGQLAQGQLAQGQLAKGQLAKTTDDLVHTLEKVVETISNGTSGKHAEHKLEEELAGALEGIIHKVGRHLVLTFWFSC